MKTLASYHQAKFNSFDWIRFLAAFFVIFSHSFALTNTPLRFFTILPSFPNGTNQGVVAFFAISGFLVTESFVNRDQPLVFLKCRLLRLFPALIICTLFSAFIIGVIVTSLSIHDYLSNPSVYLFVLHNAFLHHLQQSLPGVFTTNHVLTAVNGSLWTLPIEFRCYLLVLILGTLFIFKRKIFRVIYLFAIAILLIGFFRQKINQETTLYLTFLLGSSIYLLRKYIVLDFKILILLMILTWLLKNTLLFPLILLLTFVFLIFLCAYQLPKAGKFLTKYGDFSYGLYIYAFPVQQTIIHFWKGINGWQELLLSLPLVFLLAIASWFLIEKPMLRFKNVNIWPRKLLLFKSIAN